MNNRKTALVMAIVMAAGSLWGCGGAKKGESASTETDGIPTVTMMCIDQNGGALQKERSDEVIAKLKEYTSTNIEFNWVAVDNLEEKIGVTLLNKDDMPMIMTIGSDLNASIVQAARSGAFWDLNDFIWDKEKFPNLSQANPKVCDQLTVDGKLIGIYRARAIGRNGFGYRKDWADKLGLSAPETIEDMYNMCYQFTYGDPDGNGKDDTYGLSMSKTEDPFDIIQCWFGAGNKWVERDGKLLPSFQTQEYKEGLDWLKKMYDEKLFYEDFAVRDTNSKLDAIKSGECGVLVSAVDDSKRCWDYFVTQNVPGVNGEENASMEICGTLAKKAGDEPVTLSTSGMNGFFVITKAAKTDADVEACLHFLDKLCDNEMLTMVDHGLEGMTYSFNEKGQIVDNPEYLGGFNKPQNGLNQAVCYIPNLVQTEPEVAFDDRRIIEYAVREDNEKYVVYNAASKYLVNTETYFEVGATLDQIISSARTQYICGEIDEAGLQAAWDNWANQGGSKLIDEVNALYQENSK